MNVPNAKLSEMGQAALKGELQAGTEIYVEPTEEFFVNSNDKFYDIFANGKYVATMHWLCFYDYTGEW